MTGKPPVLEIDRLQVAFLRAPGSPHVVDRADLAIEAGEVHGLVGESGSGKTMLARAALDLLPPGAEIVGGTIRFQGKDLTMASTAEMRSLRGAHIGMVFQEPMMSLNPALRIGRQMAEGMRLHTDLDETEIRRRSVEMLERVRMPDPQSCLSSYPHEFSGGMRQRIMLASVLMLRPALLLADEPTTALDVLIQQEVLEIMLEIVRDLGTAVLLITHDLGLVAKYAQRLTVMQAGKVVEHGSLAGILARPREPYTKRLLAALPRRSAAEGGTADEDTPVVAVRDLRVTFGGRAFLPWRRGRVVNAVNGLTFDVRRNETMAVVGESGSGKTTLGRAILKLVESSNGQILFEGKDIGELRGRRERQLRRRMQIVFQDPYSSLDPRMSIGQIVGEGLRHVPHSSRAQKRRTVETALAEVEIDPAWTERYPHELSGGQRQRVGIARAIVTRPRLIIADEAVSALDLTVQAQVLKLLKRLQRDIGFSYLFITHDLGVVEQIADRILVMYRGRMVELGSRDSIFDRPRHPYTCALLNAVPELVGDSAGGYRLQERRYTAPEPPDGHGRDPHYLPGSESLRPTILEVGKGHFVAYGASS